MSEVGVGELLNFWVPGKPKTKGSMTVVNGRQGVMRDTAGSKRWRQLVAYAAAWATGEAMASLGDIFPLMGKVTVDLLFVLPTHDVTKHGVGDIDKLARNVLDALTDAGVYGDDVQVAKLIAQKITDPLESPGVRIKVL